MEEKRWGGREEGMLSFLRVQRTNLKCKER